MTKLAQMPPMQVLCTAPRCRRRQDVPLTDVYAVQVRNRSGGTHKDAATVCRRCGEEIVVPASFLRRGVLSMLPSRAEFESSRAPVVPIGATPRLPAWSVGAEASAALDAAFSRIATGGGDVVGLAVQDGIQQTVDLPLDRNGALLALDAAGCHLMVACGPNPDGSTWQVVLHPASGVATMTSAAG